MDKDLISAIDKLLSHDCIIESNQNYTLCGYRGKHYEVWNESNEIIYEGGDINKAISVFDI